MPKDLVSEALSLLDSGNKVPHTGGGGSAKSGVGTKTSVKRRARVTMLRRKKLLLKEATGGGGRFHRDENGEANKQRFLPYQGNTSRLS
eukprot:CAMPEP_0167765444 /NCGR_PEP_ID=MMETSP0110_2-20121227/14691_1 /TAXON_ID=629695 /ORGANISM="Gymnochlora sp., Strain CCMP2014" /LENGTH=88 /DNA_ID=CAMNT_0007653159 /DNA_START=6 /DNA_END=269 /DNA_ORIENTATION=+